MMPKLGNYPVQTCVVCRKSTDDWIEVDRYVLQDNEMVEKNFLLCSECSKKLLFWEKRAESIVVTIFLVSQGVDLTKLLDGHHRE